MISCIIPTYNRSVLLEDAIASILVQSYTDWELIIVDDQSTDNTKDLINKYLVRDSRIKYFKNPGKGGSSARNYGIKKAKGDYIAFLDDDDVCLPHRFESQLDVAKKLRSRFVVSGYQVRNRSGEVIIAEYKNELKGKGAGFPSRWLIKKELLEIVGGFDETFPSMQEIELSYRLAEYESFVMHDKIVTIIYSTNESVSKRKNNAIDGKKLLINKLSGIMLPLEEAWWNYSLGMDYLQISNNIEAINSFRKAAKNDKRGLYKFGYLISRLSFTKNKIFKSFLQRLLFKIHNFRFKVQEHIIVK